VSGPVGEVQVYAWAATGPPECRRLAATIRRWEPEILAWHTNGGASNGPTEAVNLLIKKVKEPATASATSTTTDCACYCTAAWTGTMPPLHASGPVVHTQRRRAAL